MSHKTSIIELNTEQEGREEGGSVRVFRRKFLCATVPMSFAVEHLCTVFQIFSGREKLRGDRGSMRVVVSSFPPEFFRFTVPKKFVAESLSVSLIPILIKVWIGEGGRDSQFSVSNFCPTVTNHFVEEAFCAKFQKISCSEKFTDKRGDRDDKGFPSTFFFVTVPKNFVDEPFCVSESFWYRKKLWMRWRGVAVSRYSVEIYLSHSTEAFRRETLLCGVSENFLQTKSLWIKADGRGGRLKFFRPNFFSHSGKKFSRGTLLCFGKFLVSKYFKPNRRISPFSIEILFLKVLKNFVVESFSVSLIPILIKVRIEEGGRDSQFSVANFCPTVTNNFVEEAFCAKFQKISCSEKFTDKRGDRDDKGFPSTFFFLTVPKNFFEEPFCVSESF